MQHYENDKFSKSLFGDGTRLYIDTEEIDDHITSARLAKYDETGEIASISIDIEDLQDDERDFALLFYIFIDIVNDKFYYEEKDFADYLSDKANFADDFSPEFIRKTQKNYDQMLKNGEKLEEIIPKDTLEVFIDAMGSLDFLNLNTDDIINIAQYAKYMNSSEELKGEITQRMEGMENEFDPPLSAQEYDKIADSAVENFLAMYDYDNYNEDIEISINKALDEFKRNNKERLDDDLER